MNLRNFQATDISEQKGATLIVAILMLTLVTIYGISNLREVLFNEKIVTNVQIADEALVSAETTVGNILSDSSLTAIYTSPLFTRENPWTNTLSLPSTNGLIDASVRAYSLGETSQSNIPSVGTSTSTMLARRYYEMKVNSSVKSSSTGSTSSLVDSGQTRDLANTEVTRGFTLMVLNSGG